jgi:hypothetical protein
MIEDDDTNGMGAISSPEIRAYKAMFATITAIQTQEFESIQSKVDTVLNKMKRYKSIPVELQEHIRMLKNALSSQTVKTSAYIRLLQDLLHNEEDLALMNLTLLKTKPSLYW